MSEIHLSNALSAKLAEFASHAGRTAEAYAQELLQQSIEDRIDYLAAVASIDRQTSTVSLEELERRFGLGDLV